MERKKRELQTGLPPRSDPNYGRLYREIHKDRLKLVYLDWYNRNKEIDPNFKRNRYKPEKMAEYRDINRPKLKEKQWKSRGIIDLTYEKYQEDLALQNENCKICGHHMTKPQADHDYSTGKYRGLLCTRCNLVLGIYEKRQGNFDQFQRYLDEHNSIDKQKDMI